MFGDHLEEFIINGCREGLKDSEGKSLWKNWKVLTTVPEIADHFRKRKCNCGLKIKDHSRCQGKETKGTELYTDAVRDGVHEQW